MKFFTQLGRFPQGRSELPDEAVEYVARQGGVEPGEAGAHSVEPGPRPAVHPEPAEHR
ncbi:hypothetical protein [Parafrankia soli]|uniref:hypothetical protein n=1 Tax=Parafrankia soli TaxID=2599596 RepID=UPI0012FFA21C|nr:hypothetical protein [Parafrankia soli]